ELPSRVSRTTCISAWPQPPGSTTEASQKRLLPPWNAEVKFTQYKRVLLERIRAVRVRYRPTVSDAEIKDWKDASRL
ncbi:MAG: hypothetical protein ACRERS_07190, partial [Methylococcales bacterium]